MPTLGKVLRQGDHGIGVLEEGQNGFAVVRGRGYTFAPDFSAMEVSKWKTAQSAAITRFHPEIRIQLSKPQYSWHLLPQLERVFGASLGQGAFRIDGWFSSVRVRSEGSVRPENSADTVDAETLCCEFSDAMGTIVGFTNVEPHRDATAHDHRLYFVDAQRRFGGRVMDFEVLRARAELSPIRRVSYKS